MHNFIPIVFAFILMCNIIRKLEQNYAYALLCVVLYNFVLKKGTFCTATFCLDMFTNIGPFPPIFVSTPNQSCV